MDHKVGDIWYRYQEQSYSVVVDADRDEYSSRTQIERHQFWVIRVTPKGVWLSRKYRHHGDKCPSWPKKDGHFHVAPRFCLHSARKRFACATDELAKESFVKRKEKQKAIYKARAKQAQKAIDSIKGGTPGKLSFCHLPIVLM